MTTNTTTNKVFVKAKTEEEAESMIRSLEGIGSMIRRLNGQWVTAFDASSLEIERDGTHFILTCILKVSKNQGGFDLLSPLDSSRMLGTWKIVS